MKKTYAKSGQSCRVTFRLPAEVAGKSVALCGEFNNWDDTKHLLTRRKNGDYSLTISLQPGEFRFRYLVDGNRWENDWDADKYLPNNFGSEDSVVVV